MIDTSLLDQYRNSLTNLKNPVRLVLFIKDAGCETCPDAVRTAQEIKARAPKVALEIYDQVMDRDKADQYGVKQVPATIIQAGNGRLIRFYGLVQDVFLKMLLETIVSVAEARTWFPENISRTLSMLQEEVGVQVFVESDCPQCVPVAETAICLAFENDLIVADIIIAEDFPELIRKYSIKTLPKTVFGPNLHMDGHVSESQFLEMIFQAEGLRSGPERRCLVCGTPSSDVICGSCKTRIQAEAIDHKQKGERVRHDVL